MVLLLHLDLYC